MPNTNPADLDREALEKALEAYCSHLSGRPDPSRLADAIRAYEAAKPRASGVPEAELREAFNAGVAWQKEMGALPHVAAPSGEADLRQAMQEAIDLLLEKKHGNPARSASHNARVCLQFALTGDVISPIASEPKDAGGGEGLKPCPFCGKRPETHYHYDGMDIYGVNCGGHAGFDGETLKEAADKWNTRTAPSGVKP